MKGDFIPKGAGSGGDGRTMGKENNLSSVMEYDFDFQRYIEARLREIDDLDERGYAKKVILEGLGAVIRHTKKSIRSWSSGFIKRSRYRITNMRFALQLRSAAIMTPPIRHCFLFWKRIWIFRN